MDANYLFETFKIDGYIFFYLWHEIPFLIVLYFVTGKHLMDKTDNKIKKIKNIHTWVYLHGHIVQTLFQYPPLSI